MSGDVSGARAVGTSRTSSWASSLGSPVMRRLVAPALIFGVVGGVVMGLGWAAVTPAGWGVPQDGFFYSLSHRELVARQDGVFAAFAAAFGLAHGVFVVWWLRELPLLTVAWHTFAGVLGSVLAWFTGSVVGTLQSPGDKPASFDQAVVAPLEVHAYGVLFIWPALACSALVFGLFVLTSFRRVPQPPHDGPL